MGRLGSLIETYDAKNVPDSEGNLIEALQCLMEEHDLKQSDLPEIGSRGVVLEVLAGRRQLNVRQIRGLSERISVSRSLHSMVS